MHVSRFDLLLLAAILILLCLPPALQYALPDSPYNRCDRAGGQYVEGVCIAKESILRY